MSTFVNRSKDPGRKEIQPVSGGDTNIRVAKAGCEGMGRLIESTPLEIVAYRLCNFQAEITLFFNIVFPAKKARIHLLFRSYDPLEKPGQTFLQTAENRFHFGGLHPRFEFIQ